MTPLRKLIFDYDPLSPSQHGIRYVPPEKFPFTARPADVNFIDRGYIGRPLLSMARLNPDVEILVRKVKRGKAAVLRGYYGASRSHTTSSGGLTFAL